MRSPPKVNVVGPSLSATKATAYLISSGRMWGSFSIGNGSAADAFRRLRGDSVSLIEEALAPP